MIFTSGFLLAVVCLFVAAIVTLVSGNEKIVGGWIAAAVVLALFVR